MPRYAGEMLMNPKQIAFISCVNDKEEYMECRHYIEKLYIPKSYETELIAIEGASSMAAGYNAGGVPRIK